MTDIDVQLKAALAANERDRSIVADTLKAITDAIAAYDWATDGRGSYEWNDDEYRDVFGEALDAISRAAQPLRKIACDLSNCPELWEDVAVARRTPDK